MSKLPVVSSAYKVGDKVSFINAKVVGMNGKPDPRFAESYTIVEMLGADRKTNPQR